MTRRDRAALSLAYECVRRNTAGEFCDGKSLRVVNEARTVLLCGTDGLRGERMEAFGVYEASAVIVPSRLLRARLALLLRAMLREVPMAFVVRDDGDGCLSSMYEPLRYHALWESAPPHVAKETR